MQSFMCLFSSWQLWQQGAGERFSVDHSVSQHLPGTTLANHSSAL